MITTVTQRFKNFLQQRLKKTLRPQEKVCQDRVDSGLYSRFCVGFEGQRKSCTLRYGSAGYVMQVVQEGKAQALSVSCRYKMGKGLP